jgi:U3 small nucleolar RNA-associated protein 16
MLTHVLSTAKRIFSRSPSFQGREEDASNPIPANLESDASANMVTTRRGTGVDVTPMSTPASSTRKTRGKRELRSLEIEETPIAAKRRRTLVGATPYHNAQAQEEAEEDATATPTQAPEPTIEVADEADIQDEISDTIAVSIPLRTKERSSSVVVESKTPLSRRGSPKVIIRKRSSGSSEASPTESAPAEGLPSTQDVFYTPVAQRSSPPPATSTAQSNREGSITPKATSQTKKRTPKSASKSRKAAAKQYLESDVDPAPTSNLPDEIPSSTWESEQAPISTLDSVPQSTPSKKAHKRFGSEEPLDVAAPTPVENAPEVTAEQEANKVDDDGSDSDDAPEMVTTATAVSKARATAEETLRAHQAQQEKEQKRKQQRAERLAEEQAEKRKREEKREKKLAKRQAREERASGADPALPDTSLDIDMKSLPALLPDSILQAAGDRRPASPPASRSHKTAEQLRKEKLNRHIKFLEHGEKPVKDKKKGSINVSVLAQKNKLLAPKVNENSKGIREHWLKGRQREKISSGKKANFKNKFRKMERRAVGGGGGFLRGRDD